MIQTSGFLVPTKTYGQLEVYNLDSGEGPWNMASDVSGKDWSYHSVIWIDIDGDGLEDALTARFDHSVFFCTFFVQPNPMAGFENGCLFGVHCLHNLDVGCT